MHLLVNLVTMPSQQSMITSGPLLVQTIRLASGIISSVCCYNLLG
jgi:hypothetical protein